VNLLFSCKPAEQVDTERRRRRILLFCDLHVCAGKLQTLDVLLRRMKAETHRVLIFTQMTKML